MILFFIFTFVDIIYHLWYNNNRYCVYNAYQKFGRRSEVRLLCIIKNFNLTEGEIYGKKRKKYY